MITINRENIRKLVEVFYQPPFKTFYVNSTDGETFIKPIGVFVSLGITTSMNVIKNIKEIINNTPGYSAQVVELSSLKVGGQYLNYVTKVDPAQILIPDIKSAKLLVKLKPGEDILDEGLSIKEVESLKDLMYPDQDLKVLQEYAPRVTKLQGMIDKLNKNDEWSNCWIQKKTNGDYKYYHRAINYANCGDIEYRIGIYVYLT